MSTTMNQNAIQATTTAPVVATENVENTPKTPRAPSRPANFAKKAWDQATYDAYLDLVKIVTSSMSIPEFLTAHAALFANANVPAVESTVISLLIAMAKDTSKKDKETGESEKIRHINPIASLRAFFNGGWKERASYRIDYTAPKAPKKNEPKPKVKKSASETIVGLFNGMTEEERAALIAALTGNKAA